MTIATDLGALYPDLKDQSVVVVGATGALGSLVAYQLADLGASVTIAGGNAEKLSAMEKEISGRGGKVCVVPVRPDTEGNADEIIAGAVKAFGRIDGLVDSGGQNDTDLINEMSVDRFENLMDVNVRSVWLICRAYRAQALKQDSGGSVVLISSVRGKLGLPTGYSAYCSTKGAVNTMTKALATEWGASQVRVNSVAPTLFRSDLTSWVYGDDERAVKTRSGVLSRVPMGRLGEAEDMVGPTLFFLSKASYFCTGQILYVDGGYSSS